MLADKDLRRCPEIMCARPGCNTHFCYKCKLKGHQGMSCKRNRQLVAQERIMQIEHDVTGDSDRERTDAGVLYS